MKGNILKLHIHRCVRQMCIQINVRHYLVDNQGTYNETMQAPGARGTCGNSLGADAGFTNDHYPPFTHICVNSLCRFSETSIIMTSQRRCHARDSQNYVYIFNNTRFVDTRFVNSLADFGFVMYQNELIYVIIGFKHGVPCIARSKALRGHSHTSCTNWTSWPHRASDLAMHGTSCLNPLMTGIHNYFKTLSKTRYPHQQYSFPPLITSQPMIWPGDMCYAGYPAAINNNQGFYRQCP